MCIRDRTADELGQLKVSANLQNNMDRLQEIYDRCDDIVMRRFEIGTQRLPSLLIYLEGYIDKNRVAEIMNGLMLQSRLKMCIRDSASSVPKWSSTSRVTPAPSNPKRRWKMTRCPELLTGKNSVSPCTTPSRIALIKLIVSSHIPESLCSDLFCIAALFPARGK